MTIETLAAKKDKIYYIFNGRVQCGIVERVRINIEATFEPAIIEYGISGQTFWINESNCSLSQENLFEIIRLKE